MEYGSVPVERLVLEEMEAGPTTLRLADRDVQLTVKTSGGCSTITVLDGIIIDRQSVLALTVAGRSSGERVDPKG